MRKDYRQNFNKGGGADTGKMGEIKSKVTLASDKIKKLMSRIGEPGGRLSQGDIKRAKDLLASKKIMKSPMQRQRVLDKLKSEAQKTGGNVMSADEMFRLKGESDKSFTTRMQKAFSAKKGGRAALKRGGGKFPDYSGDGKITMKDILMGRGVIKKKNKKKMMAKKFKSPMEKSIKGKKA